MTMTNVADTQELRRSVEQQLQANPLLPAAGRVRWLIDSLSYKSGKMTMDPSKIAARLQVEVRIVKKVLKEDVERKIYKKVGGWEYQRIEKDRKKFEMQRMAETELGVSTRFVRIIFRLASGSKEGLAGISDKEMMERLQTSHSSIFVARKLMKKLGFTVIEGNGRTRFTTYRLPALCEAAAVVERQDTTNEVEVRPRRVTWEYIQQLYDNNLTPIPVDELPAALELMELSKKLSDFVKACKPDQGEWLDFERKLTADWTRANCLE